MNGSASDLSGAYGAIARKSLLFRMSSGLVQLKPWAQTPAQTEEWLGRTRGQFGVHPSSVIVPIEDTPSPSPRPVVGLPDGMPVKQQGGIDWKPLENHASRLYLFNETLKSMNDTGHVALLRSELPLIWARPLAGNSRKWLFFHPSLNREIVLKVFEIHNDRTVSVRRGDGLVESMDNLVFGLLHFHGVSSEHWPCRRKGSKKRRSPSTQNTG